MMRQDRFTEGAQEVLAASQELVRKERHSQWDVEHVLMALLTHEGGAAPAIFEKLGADRAKLREAVGNADEREGEAARILDQFGIDKEKIYRALQEVRGGARVDSPTAESKYRA